MYERAQTSNFSIVTHTRHFQVLRQPVYSHCRSAAVRINKDCVTVLFIPSGSDLTLCNATTTSKATPPKAPTALFRTQLLAYVSFRSAKQTVDTATARSRVLYVGQPENTPVFTAWVHFQKQIDKFFWLSRQPTSYRRELLSSTRPVYKRLI